jgi:hypothetical protein
MPYQLDNTVGTWQSFGGLFRCYVFQHLLNCGAMPGILLEGMPEQFVNIFDFSFHTENL